jgi:hypothetical protein
MWAQSCSIRGVFYQKKGGNDSAMVMASARVEEWVQLNIKIALVRENRLVYYIIHVIIVYQDSQCILWVKNKTCGQGNLTGALKFIMLDTKGAYGLME